MNEARRSPDPIRAELRPVRRAFFRLHKALIDAERRGFETRRGDHSNAEFLQALINHPELGWIQPMTRLLVRVDEVLADRGPLARQAARELILEIRDMVEPSDAPAAAAYERLRERDPDVLLAHVELTSAIAAVLAA